MATAPTASADTPTDQFLDVLLGGAPGDEGGGFDFSDLFTGEGTAFDQLVDGFYAQADQFLDVLFFPSDPLMIAGP